MNCHKFKSGVQAASMEKQGNLGLSICDFRLSIERRNRQSAIGNRQSAMIRCPDDPIRRIGVKVWGTQRPGGLIGSLQS
jgi:hypothetical protein